MLETADSFAVDESLEPGLRYTEEIKRENDARPQRVCKLWAEGMQEPVSQLTIVSFEKRFGAVSVFGEGLGGVSTHPQQRQKGYIGKLLRRVCVSMAARVDVGFVSEAIEGLYEKFGFVNCLTEGEFVLPLRFIERLQRAPVQPGRSLRPFSPDDLPAMVELFNTAHGQRPWSHVRPNTWNELRAPRTWQAGSEAVVLQEDPAQAGGGLAGYAIVTERRFGVVYAPYVIHELAAADVDAARRLLAYVAAMGAEQGAVELRLREPRDSAAGRVARGLGGEYRLHDPASGGMMGGIFRREPLLAALEPELRRRVTPCKAAAGHDAAFVLLAQGGLIEDDHTLLRLLLGYRSMADVKAGDADGADAVGIATSPYAAVLSAWFPGGGAPTLPQAYAHELDRY